MALRLAALKRRATAAGIPAIYINDNFGRWRSDFRQTVAHCTAPTSPGGWCRSACGRLARLLRPEAKALRLLRYDARHAAEALSIRRVILTGIAGNICVLFTANDA